MPALRRILWKLSAIDSDVYPLSRRRRWRCEDVVERGHRKPLRRQRDATRRDPDATVRDGRYALAIMRAAV